MRQAMREIHGAVNRIDDPANLRIVRTTRSFLAQKRDRRERRVQFSFDQSLGANVQFELDIVGRFDVHLFCSVQVLAHEPAGGARGVNRGSLSFQKIHETVDASTPRCRRDYSGVLTAENAKSAKNSEFLSLRSLRSLRLIEWFHRLPLKLRQRLLHMLALGLKLRQPLLV